MTDHELALCYAPIVHFDRNETIPLRAVGYTIARETMRSLSFPKRDLLVPQGAACVIEYAYYWDYDIGHGYDLEHIWVTVGKNGQVMAAEGSFHGQYLNLYIPALSCCKPLLGDHVQADCQPGKHAFLPDGQLFRLIPYWFECCNQYAGGPILIGNPFSAKFSPTGEDLFSPTAEENAQCIRYLKETLAFEPAMEFTKDAPDTVAYMPWEEMYEKIPQWIRMECARLKALYQGEERE